MRFIEALLPDLFEAGEHGRVPGDAEAAQITDREHEMLTLLEKGLSNHEIGGRLGISVPTVKWHLHNLFSKIEVRNRSSAARFARENNLA